MTEGAVIAALAKRFAAPAWAFLAGVANGTGHSRRQRREADAIALSLWPSRGLELHGFEVKVSRSDWQRELKEPEKSVEIQRFCHRWWIATPPDIVRAGELPPTWGHMEINGRGAIAKVEAPKLDAMPLDMPMIAAIFRRATEGMTPRVAIEDAVRAGVAEELARRAKSDKSGAEWERDQALEQLEQLRRECAEFEAASGLRIVGYIGHGKRLGEAVNRVLHIDPANTVAALSASAKELRRIAETAEEHATMITEAAATARERTWP